MSDFDKAFALIIGVEGGYQSPEQAKERHDSGGETKYGISKKYYPNLDIKNLTLDQAKDIYKKNYWDKLKGDQITFPLNILMFDASINQGLGPAIKLLQRVLNIQQDGIVGERLLSRVKKVSSELLALYMAERTLRYTGTRNFDVDGRGWIKRLFLIILEVK